MNTKNKIRTVLLTFFALGSVFLLGYIAGANRYSLYVAHILTLDESTGAVVDPGFAYSDQRDVFPSHKDTLFPASRGVTIEFDDGRKALIWLGVRSSESVEIPFYLDGYEKRNLSLHPNGLGFRHYPNSKVEKILFRKQSEQTNGT